MAVRGIRGAINVARNTPEEIVRETRTLIEEIVRRNSFSVDEVCSILFTVTSDLNADFPATAARKLGFTMTPLLCMTEIPVPGSMSGVVRVLFHVNTDRSQQDMVHVYLKEAAKLRPDLSG